VTAARRLGINRNTLHKKVNDYQRAEAGAAEAARAEGAAGPEKSDAAPGGP
jgi:hypothetical protein